MKQERIQVLKDILLDLHHGASLNSVQERFNQYFKGVSALEISLMEHYLPMPQLMKSNSIFQLRKYLASLS